MAARGRERLGDSIRPSQLVWKLSDVARQIRQARILAPHEALGRKGEDLAHRYLQRAGFSVLARNYRPFGGEAEVDIIGRIRDTLVFFEVKSRSSAEFGTPDRAVDETKQRHIRSAARNYATRAGIDWNTVRFDIISVIFGNPPSISHLEDAFPRR